MMETTVARLPSMRTVAMEQLRVVGLAVRRECLLLCAGLVLFVLIAPRVEDFAPEGRRFVLDPEILGYLAMLVALVAPLGVWKGERRFGESQLWSVPVDHARHARLKIASGWLWLMAMLSVGLMVLVSGVALNGGSVGVDEMRLLVADPARPIPAGPPMNAPWSTQPWQWMVPFTAATAAYLAASAFLIGLRRPVHWAVGCWLGLLAFGLVSANVTGWVANTAETLVYLFDLTASGGSESAQALVLLESGERVRVWTRLPTMGSWAAGTVMWISLAGAAAWAATSRNREA